MWMTVRDAPLVIFFGELRPGGSNKGALLGIRAVGCTSKKVINPIPSRQAGPS